MKLSKRIHVCPDYDSDSNACYVVTKEKGRLSLNEVRQALREYECDYYFLLADCFHEENEEPQFSYEQSGDVIIAYPASDMFKRRGSNTMKELIEKEKYDE